MKGVRCKGARPNGVKAHAWTRSKLIKQSLASPAPIRLVGRRQEWRAQVIYIRELTDTSKMMCGRSYISTRWRQRLHLIHSDQCLDIELPLEIKARPARGTCKLKLAARNRVQERAQTERGSRRPFIRTDDDRRSCIRGNEDRLHGVHIADMECGYDWIVCRGRTRRILQGDLYLHRYHVDAWKLRLEERFCVAQNNHFVYFAWLFIR